MAAAIIVTHSTRSETTVRVASSNANLASIYPVGTPQERTTSGSNVVNSRCLNAAKRAAPATIETATIANRSVCLIPRMLPDGAASKSRVKFLFLLMSATPSAKLEVVTIPMAACAPMLRQCVVRFIITAESNPHMLAPSKKFIVSTCLTPGASEYGVGQSVHNVGHPPENDVHADHTTQFSDQRGDDQPPAEELILKGCEHRCPDPATSETRAHDSCRFFRRSAATSRPVSCPCSRSPRHRRCRCA